MTAKKEIYPEKEKPEIAKQALLREQLDSVLKVGDHSELISVISKTKNIQVYDRDGKLIFTGTPKQLMIFWTNKDYGSADNIANISDDSGKTICRFGPGDRHGFIARKKIPELFKQLGLIIDGNAETEELAEDQEVQLLKQIKQEHDNVYWKRRATLKNDLFLTSYGMDPDTGEMFERVSGEIGQYFDSHGIAKLNQLEKLLTLLKNGIDPNKAFYTAPFEVPNDKRAALGSALGTGGGTAYKDGIAVITSGYKQDLGDGIKHVFINDVYKGLITPLQSLFPQYQFHLLSEQKKVLEAEVK